MRLLLLSSPLLALAGCAPDTDIREQKRVLDSFTYVDCGVLAPGTRTPVENGCAVPLFSRERGKVTIFDIRVTDVSFPEGGVGEDGAAFLIRDEYWQKPDCGEGDCLVLEGYDEESDADTLALPVVFAPMAEGEYRAELTIWSNDNQTEAEEPLPDDPERSEPVWKVQLRAQSRPACGRVWPTFVDMGRRDAPGAEFGTTAKVENCGIVPLEIEGFPEAGSGVEEMTVSSSTPMFILPGMSEEISVAWVVGAPTDGEPTPVSTQFGFSSNSETLTTASLTVVGNDCELSVSEDWDDDGDGWFVCGGDCDDGDPTANPSVVERAANGRDDDCDGTIDEGANPVGSDDDGDGYAETGGDCDDADATVSPVGVETLNHVDDDCNGFVDDQTEWYDDDRDGFSERQGDADDNNRLVYPGATETPDGVDNDGDGVIDEGGPTYDDDLDGQIDAPAGDDCDDFDPWTYAGAFEYCDGYDNDCDSVVDEGPDDEADGACAFLPEREGEAVAPAAAGCSTGGGAVLPVGILVASALAVRRRRNRRIG